MKTRIRFLLPVSAGILLAASTAWACTLVMVSPVVITSPLPAPGEAFAEVDPGDSITVSATGLHPDATYRMRFGQPCQSTPTDPMNTVCTVGNTYEPGGHGCMLPNFNIGSVSSYTPEAGSIIGATGTIPPDSSTTAGLAQICFAPVATPEPDPDTDVRDDVGSGSAYVYVTS